MIQEFVLYRHRNNMNTLPALLLLNPPMLLEDIHIHDSLFQRSVKPPVP